VAADAGDVLPLIRAASESSTLVDAIDPLASVNQL
jgi:hypothetical protein